MNEHAVEADHDLLIFLTDYLAGGGAPMVQHLGFVATEASRGDVTFALPVTPTLVHAGGVLCGQAIMAAMDTGMVFVMASLFDGNQRPFTTVTLNTVFERALQPTSGK